MDARDWASRPRNKRWLLVIAFAIFMALAVAAFRNLPAGVEFRPIFMVLIALIGTPATWLLNAFEYRSIAKAAGHRVTFDNALQVSLAASLANYLPAPGGVAVRTAALKLEGSSLGAALSVNAIAGVIWIGATALLVGIVLLTDAAFAVQGAAVATVGAAILLGGALTLRWRLPGWRGVFVQLLVIETSTTLAAAFRVTLAFAAIGQSASVVVAITLASAQVLATATGIFPAGLGIREALAAGLAVAIQISAAVAVAASAVERVSGLTARVVFVPILGLYLRRVSRRHPAAGEEGSPERGSQALPHLAAGPIDSTIRDPDQDDD